MKTMTSFERWQVIVNSIQAGILLMTFLGAIYIGLRQNEINDRLRALQDYVAVVVVPDARSGKINLINIGKTNLYLWGFDMPGNNQRLKKSRLISAGTNDAAYYWIDPPPNLGAIKVFPHQFEFKLYLEDEFGQKWVSEHGGEADKIKTQQDGKPIDTIAIKVWSYKTYRNNWEFK